MLSTKIRQWTIKIILNYIVKSIIEMLENVCYSLADYFDALTVKLQKQNKKRKVIPKDMKKTALDAAAALAG